MLFFDAGPVISLVMSRLGWLLPLLKKQFNGQFYITPAVKLELVDRPLQVKRFEFEALEVSKMIRERVFEVYDAVPKKRADMLIHLANSSFRADNKTVDVIQKGEVESAACCLELGVPIVMDERTLRLFIESPEEMKNLLETRFNKEVSVDEIKMREFSTLLQGITIIRSIELVGVAYRLGLLNDYILAQKEGKGMLLDAVLWPTKYNGCSVTEHEIEELKGYLLQ